ncbi:MAG: sigma-70 family RNA polymerase sigma factor [Kiritimatiellia bacterium]|jgi:RNA polymerase sigma-70 factor (ECF subfamily)|nr:sigma-70 family RNA polymerase sigma factor [Kiritimatiellia bacterium]
MRLEESSAADARFRRLLAEAQGDLFAFVYMLTGNRHTAEDLVQDTNVMLLRHAAEYDPQKRFLPWAKAFAHNRVRTFLKKELRSPLVFNSELAERLAEEIWGDSGDAPEGALFAYLDDCMARLTTEQRSLIRARYFRMESVAALAAGLKRSEISVYVLLHRIRRLLGRCIEKKMRAAGIGVRA